MVDLGTLSAIADPVSSATSVNDAGQVVGYSYTNTAGGSAGYHAFVVNPQTVGQTQIWYADADGDNVNDYMQDLGTLGGLNSWARRINNNGEAVGESDYDPATSEHYVHAFRWQANTMYDLGTLHSDRLVGFSSAAGINGNGAVVGWAENDDGERRAFVWEAGVMQDLNEQIYPLDENGKKVTPGITLSEARDINEDGLIVGWGIVKGSGGAKTRGFLLTPVMIDPATLIAPTDPNEATPTTPNTAPNRTDYTSDTDFGAPGVTSTLSTTTADGSTTTRAKSGGFCGVSAAGFVPLTLAGIACLRVGRRRTSRR
jgi:probable HAF family extracellular repeat protein